MLVVDDNQYMRKVVRNMLVNIGVKTVYEAADGIAGLEAIRMFDARSRHPRLGNAAAQRRRVGAHRALARRVPGAGRSDHHAERHGDRWRVVEAARIGVNEYLLKPVSAKALLDRIVAIIAGRAPIVQLGDYYGPEPRKLVVMNRCRRRRSAARRRGCELNGTGAPALKLAG